VSADEKFVIKFMPEQIAEYDLYQKIVNSDCYKIKLIRENKLEQITSYYVASMTDIWNDHRNEFARGREYTVDISLDQIKTSINIITKNDFLLENLDIQFDEEVTYEQLVEQKLLTSGTIKLHPPTNYKIIKQHIEYEYNKSR
jgi:LPS sulfotransferase NodH